MNSPQFKIESEKWRRETLQPVSFYQWVRDRLGLVWIQYPKVCAICATPTKGNRVTGYASACECY